MIKPAIIVVGYNRPDGVKRLLNSIGKARFESFDIPLIISIDESNLSNEVEKVAIDFNWKYGTKEIIRFPKRQGLRNHIVLCGDYSEKYGGVIILEDDLIVSEDFYLYVSRAHDYYSKMKEICGVSLYSYKTNVFTHYTFSPLPTINDVFLGDMVVTWGQSWTFEQWKKFKEWYIKNENKLSKINKKLPRDISTWTRSWGRYFAFYMQENSLSYIYPYISRTTCFSDFGEHTKNTIPFTFVQVPLMHGCPKEYRFDLSEKLVHYDSFFERVLNDEYKINNIPCSQICFDLNNMKCETLNQHYVLTNSVLPYRLIKSYGLTLRPIELNALYSVPGNQLNLYELGEDSNLIREWKGKRPNYYMSFQRLKYEYLDATWRVLIYYTPREFINRVVDYLAKR